MSLSKKVKEAAREIIRQEHGTEALERIDLISMTAPTPTPRDMLEVSWTILGLDKLIGSGVVMRVKFIEFRYGAKAMSDYSSNEALKHELEKAIHSQKNMAELSEFSNTEWWQDISVRIFSGDFKPRAPRKGGHGKNQSAEIIEIYCWLMGVLSGSDYCASGDSICQFMAEKLQYGDFTKYAQKGDIKQSASLSKGGDAIKSIIRRQDSSYLNG
ncbi:hypothetical protein HHG37_01565, partial [Vibrio aestuarianus subsp. francensis]